MARGSRVRGAGDVGQGKSGKTGFGMGGGGGVDRRRRL